MLKYLRNSFMNFCLDPGLKSKPNQDSFLMSVISELFLSAITHNILSMNYRFEDKITDSLVIACLDGHGTFGHIISQVSYCYHDLILSAC